MPSRMLNRIGRTTAVSAISEPVVPKSRLIVPMCTSDHTQRTSHAKEDHCKRHRYSERDLHRIGIIQRDFRPGQMHGQERAQHVTDVDQRLARATLVDDEPYRHHSRNQHGTNQHRDQTSRPRHAPMAPISFQSPAPSALITTKGSSSNKPNPAPSREALAPGQPLVTVLTAIPASNPGTVSQFGIRR